MINQFFMNSHVGDDEPADIKMMVSPDMYKIFLDLFDLEVELLHGSVELKDDGRYHCKFSCAGYKKSMFKDFLDLLMQDSRVKVEFLGSPINNN